MKPLFLFFLLTLISGQASAQSVHYSYDAAGNRIKREIVLTRSESEPRHALKKSMASHYSETLSGKTLRIYPNPTHGMLKVELSGLTDSDRCQMRLLNNSGQQLFISEGPSATINISSQPNGVYLLHVILNDEKSIWKILKK